MKNLFTLLLVSFMLLSGTTAMADSSVTKVAIHVNEDDPQRINMALNNVANIQKYYDSVGKELIVEVVAYGPGLHMFRADTSPVIARIETMSLEMDNLSFSACGNTHRAMSEKAGKDVALLDGVSIVPSGVVRLVELQQEGFTYIRP